MRKAKTVSNEDVFKAACDLMDANVPLTRINLQRAMDIPISKIDDHIRELVEVHRKLKRTGQGIFAIIAQRIPDREVSVTHLDTGRVKVEVGDILIELSLREARKVGLCTVGCAFQHLI